jgi:hypothetical protein
MSERPMANMPAHTPKHPPGLHRMLDYGRQKGKVGWILLWLLGIPIPVLFVLFLIRGCT